MSCDDADEFRRAPGANSSVTEPRRGERLSMELVAGQLTLPLAVKLNETVPVLLQLDRGGTPTGGETEDDHKGIDEASECISVAAPRLASLCFY